MNYNNYFKKKFFFLYFKPHECTEKQQNLLQAASWKLFFYCLLENKINLIRLPHLYAANFQKTSPSTFVEPEKKNVFWSRITRQM